MFKRRLNGKMLTLLGVLLLAVCVSAFAGLRDGSWEVNPAAFRYDMSLYFRLADEDFENLEQYEIGAFVGDECRGLAEKLVLSDDESCLYMRIRSNEPSGETVDFLLRNRQSGDTVILKAKDGADFKFKSGSRVGMPSEPFMMTRFFNVAVAVDGKGSVGFSDGLYAVGSVLDLKAVPAEGYHFESWSDGSKDEAYALTVEGDTELTATFAPNIYKVGFVIDGEEVASLEVPCDAAIEAPEAPAKVGYSFEGWSELPEVMPAHDLTVTGSYAINSYKVILKVDGEVVGSYDVVYDAEIPTPAVPEKEGYSFNGWGALPERMPAHDIEMESSYTVNTYDLTFVVDGETIYSSSIAYGTSIVAPEVPAREGFTFTGWTGLPATMPAAAVEVTGAYAVNSYKLTFRVGEDIVSEAEVPFGSEIKAPADPAKEGYAFAGWSAFPASMPAHDLEVSGAFTVNSYKLAFVIDGEEVSSAVLDFGASIIAPEAPAREGYTFGGWDAEVPASMPAQDLTFTGSYAINSYRLTFLVGGEVVESSELEYGAAVKAPAAAEKEGHTFAGWSEFPATMPAHDLDVTGTYTVNMYTITFTIGDEVVYTSEVPYGSSIVAPEAPAKEGFEFTGWDAEVPSTMPAADLAFTGDYKVTDFNVTYMIEGQPAYTAKVKVGEPVPAFEAPAREGYSFSGWGEVPAVMPAQDIEFSGYYTVNSYNLTFKVDDIVVFEGPLHYGAEISAPEVPLKEGYTFNGWKDVPAVMPAADLVVESAYTVNTYTVRFMIDEVEYQAIQVPYGAKIEAPVAPDQEGHSFSGWGDIPASMPAFDLVFGGTYAENFYTVTFRIDGVTFFTDDVVFGSEIKLPEAPAREGHTFNGWGQVPETMPAYNLEYDGSYTVNSYAVTFRIGDEVIYSGSLAFGADVVAPDAPAKEGHSFSGWGVVPATMPASDLTVTGEYEINSYNVSYMADGSVFHTSTVVYGEKLTAPEAPVKEGHSFVGWSNLPETMPANDLVIDGTYAVNSYKLAFVIGEESVFSGDVLYGAEITAPEAPAKEGHTFAGWGVIPATMPASDLEVTGSYDVNYYTLSYLIDGESFSTAQVAYGSELKAPEAPVREGYSFVGWSGSVSTMPASDLVVSGTYAVNSYKLTFKAGEEVVFEGSLNYGTEISAPEAPAKVGHSFSGWGMVPAVMPASDLEVKGTYSVNSYALTYSIDGEVFYTVSMPYGSALTAPSAPAKEGYTFEGWTDAVASMPANDLVISGSYRLNSYALTFKVGDEVVFTGSIPYGTGIQAPEGPYKEGHTFTGWGMVPATMPASDLEFVGSYDVNIYRLTFDIDDELFFETQLAYGSEIVAPAEIPDKEGNTFQGWGDVPATMPANDLAVSGTYAPNHYTVTFRVGEDIVFTGEQPYGSEIVPPAAPDKEGYSFVTWGDVPATVPAGNLEFEGTYQINSYELTFSVDGVELSRSTVVYGEPVEVPEVDPKRGHTFSGFGVVPAVMPASDLHLAGTYDLNHYNVTFKVGDDVIYTAMVPFGGEIEVPAAPEKEGAVFMGWGAVPSVMPAEDKVFEGSYSSNAYTLTFRLDGVVISSEKLEFGDEVVAPEVAGKEGYTFTGWGVVPAVMPAADLEISGAYEVNHYNLVFRIGEEVVLSAQVPFGAAIQAPAAPGREGHSFNGWADVPAVMPARDLEFVSSYEVNRYRLSFVIDGQELSVSEVDFGAPVEAPEVAAKEGYSFSGWGVVPAVMPAHDVVIGGTYDINSYSILFRIGEEVFYSAQLPYGAAVQAPEVPEKEGHWFSGWEDVPAVMPASDLEFNALYNLCIYNYVFRVDGEVIAEGALDYGASISVPAVADKVGHTFSGFGIVPAVMPAYDVEFNGTYDVNSYGVVFRINDDVVYSAQLPYGSEIVAPEAPRSEGHTFSGWSEYPATVPAGEVVVTGTYTANLYRAVFVIDGEVFQTLEVPFGEAVKAPEAPEKEGYTFSGWSDVPAVMPASDIEVSGAYTVNVYKAVFMIGGEVFETLEVPFGEAVKAPEAPEKEGYTFSGWSAVPETMPASDIEVSGEYVANLYKAVFVIDGEVFETLEVPFGEAVKAPEAPAKEGYTFSGWSDVPESMPASDIEVSGSYTVNVYKAVFMIDGEVFETLEVPFGEAVKAPEAPEKEGCTFSGWSGVPETMPASDIEISGEYVANLYKVTYMLDGKVFETREVPFGSEIPVLEAPEKEGHDFLGWIDVPASMPARDIELVGEYMVLSYRLLVYVNDEVYIDEEVPFGSEIVVPDPVVEDGYKFDGWSGEIPDVMPAHEVVIYGKVSEDETVFVDGVYVGKDITVYTVDGVLLYKDVKVSDIRERLTPGVYIINGKKMVVR